MNAFAHNAFAASGGISQAAADARYVLGAGGAFTGLTGAGFRDTSAAFDVTQTFTSSTALDAGRSITWDVKNASHQLKFTAASIVTFPAGTNTLLGSAVANTITANGAASTPALHGSGTIFTGGSATTTKPYWLIEPTGTTSTGWSTSGTLFGGNAPSGFAGNLCDWHVNGVSKCRVENDGAINTASSFLQFGTSTYFKKIGNNMRWYGGGSLFEALGFGIVTGASDTADIGFARTSAGVGRISNGSTGRGTLDAAGYQVGGVAGVSGTITAASTVTVVNGIITVIA